MTTVSTSPVKDLFGKFKTVVVVSGLAASAVVADPKVDKYSPISFGDKRPSAIVLAAQAAKPDSTKAVSVFTSLSSEESKKDKVIEEQVAKLAELDKTPMPESVEGTFFSKAVLDQQNKNYRRKLDEAGFTGRDLNAEELKAALSDGLVGPNGKRLKLQAGNNSKYDLVYPSLANDLVEEIGLIGVLEKGRQKRLKATIETIKKDPNNEEAKRYKMLLAREGTLYRTVASIYALAAGIELTQNLPEAKKRYEAFIALSDSLGIRKNTDGKWFTEPGAQENMWKYIANPDFLRGMPSSFNTLDYLFAHYNTK